MYYLIAFCCGMYKVQCVSVLPLLSYINQLCGARMKNRRISLACDVWATCHAHS